MKQQTPMTCPCGSYQPYSECCGRFLLAGSYPETPEELMRSRYCAYALGNLDWIRRTWAPETLPSDLEKGEPLRWFSLEVRNATLQDESHGTVEFVARAKTSGGRAIRMHALSRFENRHGRWLYVDDDPSVT